MLAFFVFASLLLLSSAEDLIVDLPNGKIQGRILDTPSGKEFYTWRHIPFAKPPVGDLRFETPVRPDPWTGVLDGTEDSKACLFVGSFAGDPVPTNGYSEDCLYINVYSPMKPNLDLELPVMFYIYGGGFFVGTGDFAFTDPTPFLEENVIVVTFNYRLSIFGFLSTEDEVLPGNSGLKDQLAALIWTKENIARFGGNPLDITIFGESAGGMSVGYHLVSPMSRNLFTGAILQSGTSLKNSLQTTARTNAITIASQLNNSIISSSSSEEVLRVLRQADPSSLVNLTLASGIDFKPVVEVNIVAAFITQSFYESFEEGDFNQVPIIIGTNSEEDLGSISGIAQVEVLARLYDSNPNLLLPHFKLKDGVSVEAITQEIKEAYAGNSTFTDNIGAIIRWMSDDSVCRPAIQHAILQSKYTPVYFYQFSFVGTRSKDRPVIPGCGRVAHADDVPYLFNISVKPIETEADYLTRRRFVKLWTNFAKTKNPTPDDDSAELLQNVTWEPLDGNNLQYLNIGENLELKYNLKGDLAAFWSHLWETYSYRPYNTF